MKKYFYNVYSNVKNKVFKKKEVFNLPPNIKLKLLKNIPTFYFVDFENVHRLNLQFIKNEDIKIFIFLGMNQNSIDFSLVKKLQRFGENIHYIKMSHHGKNSLDFHLTYTMGEQNILVDKNIQFVIVSKDTGFDNLVRYISKIRRCRRINSL